MSTYGSKLVEWAAYDFLDSARAFGGSPWHVLVSLGEWLSLWIEVACGVACGGYVNVRTRTYVVREGTLHY